MICYLDSSVVLRIALRQPQPLKEFHDIRVAVSSKLLRAECLRTLDRLFTMEQISRKDQTSSTVFVLKTLDYIDQIPVDEVLEGVGNPMGLNLSTLDAIHLFSALKWKSVTGKDPVFLTHDSLLASAVQRFGLSVLGV